MKRRTLVSIALLSILLPVPFIIGPRMTHRDEVQEHYQIAWVYGYGSPVEFTVKASRGKISMASGVHFILEARHPVGWKVAFPRIEHTVGGLLVREQREASRRLDSSGNMITAREYRLEPLSPGLYLIPPMELMVSERRGEYVTTLRSDVIPILVTSLLPEGPTEPHLLDMIILPDHVSRWMVPLILFGGLAAIGTGVFVLRKRPVHTTTQEKPPLWKTAQAELDSLLAKGFIERGEHRLFYDSLFSFLRTYMNSRFMLQVSEKSTDELLQSIRDHQNLQKHHDTLAGILRQCDLGRFSSYPPPPEKVSESVGQLRAFLRATGTTDHPKPSRSGTT